MQDVFLSSIEDFIAENDVLFANIFLPVRNIHSTHLFFLIGNKCSRGGCSNSQLNYVRKVGTLTPSL
jgi:hypothetical protein